MHPNNDNITMNLVIREIKYINSAVNTDLGLGTPIIINSDDVTINMAICKIKYINSSITAKYPVKPNLRHHRRDNTTTSILNHFNHSAK